ncbi:MAG: hypothetical protein ACR2FN_11780 [Chitinophagaceae bacterium]
MKAIQNYLPLLSLFIGGWMVLNGILHDIFVLRSEPGIKYERDLLRLLMGGHILITCGVIQMIAYSGLKKGEHWAYYTAGVASISLLIYCAMIFPFLKSRFTIFLNIALLILLIIQFQNIN